MIFTLLSLVGTSTWSLMCGGDLMLNGIPKAVDPLSGVSSLFRNATVAYANLEIPLTSKQTRTNRKTPEDIKLKKQFVLKADPSHIETITDCGFDLLSLGNNHAMDYGPTGLNEMTSLLTQNEIAFAGAGASTDYAWQPAVKTLPNGLRVGMISFLAFMSSKALNTCTPATKSAPGIACLNLGGSFDETDRDRIVGFVNQAKWHCDLLLVAPHWGIERKSQPTAYQVSLARALIDAGADVVLGSHPHVLQPLEIYRGRPILYSLGNLISPRPSETAIFKLTFTGRKFSNWTLFGATIKDGKISLMSEADNKAAATRFRELNSAFARRHPGITKQQASSR